MSQPDVSGNKLQGKFRNTNQHLGGVNYSSLKRESGVMSPQGIVQPAHSENADSTVILITGGAGFLGQHVIRVLQENADKLQEIRVLDLRPFKNKFGVKETIPITSYVGDITEMDHQCDKAFDGVDAVFHCAAFVSYEFPPDDAKLFQVNVQGTQNVIKQCIKHNIPYLVYTSTAEVSMKPYFKNAFFGVIVNSTESRAPPPEERDGCIFGEYPWSKLEGEKCVLATDRAKLSNGRGHLRTISLRPTILYGEHDEGFLPLLMRLGCDLGGTLPRVGGPGGKHQFCYAGNAAWAHLCALRALKNKPNSIAGLPVFVTDDSFIYDQFKFCKKMSTPSDEKPMTSPSWWYIPAMICFVIAMVYENLYKIVGSFISLPKHPISPKALVVYLGSVMFFSRLRAIIHLNYSPIYEPLDAFKMSTKYYVTLLERCESKHGKRFLTQHKEQYFSNRQL